MNHMISNEHLAVTVAERGAEIQSIRAADGTEFFWSGDKAIWPKHGPNLFPYLANLTEGKYTLAGKTYEMGLHGFVPYSELAVESREDSRITFRLSANEETMKCYPFSFIYRVAYTLEQCRLLVTYSVENTGDQPMYFGIGGHPGFHLPIEPCLAFEDYRLTFDTPGRTARVTFSERGGVTGETDYPLPDGQLPLSHRLFDNGAIVLRDAGHRVRISSEKGSKAVTVSFPQMPYVGLWHTAKAQVPFLCVEPWSSLPSRDGVIEDLSKQGNLVSLDAGKLYRNTWSMEFAF